MPDPELTYRRIASGDPAAIRADVDDLDVARRRVDDARDDVYAATGIPVWTGEGASAFAVRSSGILQGLQAGYLAVDLVRGGLTSAADAFDAALASADEQIAFWRNRPAGLLAFVELILARAVDDNLRQILRGYDEQLTAITGVLTGDTDSLDLDALDDDTRDWVEDGLDRTDDWLSGDGEGSSYGPLIPNTLATGDDRNLTPQGLGYDPSSGTLLQGYHDEDSGDPSGLALIDEQTGQEIGEASLGGLPAANGQDGVPGPVHVGGVAVDGENVIVTSEDRIYTYPLDAIQNAEPGDPVPPTRVDPTVAGSYVTVRGDQLYVGDHYGNQMTVYDRGPGGGWTPATDLAGDPITISTPDNAQGLAFGPDGEFVYSTSSGRGNESQIVVDDGSGDLRYYDFPNMSQGAVIVDGELITTYESGAEEYSEWENWYDEYVKGDLWAGPYMTRTPLGELGLTGTLEAEPGSMRKAAAALDDPAATLDRVGTLLDGVTVRSGDFGQVPSAGPLAVAAQGLVDGSSSGAGTAADGVRRLATAVEMSATGYERTDEHEAGLLGGLLGGLPG